MISVRTTYPRTKAFMLMDVLLLLAVIVKRDGTPCKLRKRTQYY